MLDVVNAQGSGWVNDMWPKPGESVSTEKSAFVTKARMGNQSVLVGSGVYLAEAPKAVQAEKTMTVPELMALVRAGAAVLEKEGEKAYPEFRTKGSKWFTDNTYFFVVTMNGKGVFHAADASREGISIADTKDVWGRLYGKQYIEAASSAAGEGWVHYLYPEPGEVFSAWKSAFVKRVTYPSGEQYIVGSAAYNMRMDRAFIQDVVNRASSLVAERGPPAFEQLRDKSGPFYFMNTYVFVDRSDGVGLVNPGQPSLEGKNTMGIRDVNGKALMKGIFETATKDGGWVDYVWYKPGTNRPARKEAFVRSVQFGDKTYIVGSGLYVEAG
jgi:signal transduction histidine kinase